MDTMPVMQQLESFLSLTSRRQTVIASNMANIDTPGYRTEDVDFQKEMSKAMSSISASASAGGAGEGSLHVAVHAVPGLLERPDGNNVNMDRESTLLAEAQLQYQVGTQLLKHRFHQMLSAINSSMS